MNKIKSVLAKMNGRQVFIVVMTIIIGLFALAFKYPEQVPAYIKGIAVAGAGLL